MESKLYSEMSLGQEPWYVNVMAVLYVVLLNKSKCCDGNPSGLDVVTVIYHMFLFGTQTYILKFL